MTAGGTAGIAVAPLGRMYWGHHDWGMHVFWWIFWLLVVAAIFMFWVRPGPPRRRDSAIEALRRAYASGEISEEEYRRRLAVLNEPRSPPPDAQPAAGHAGTT